MGGDPRGAIPVWAGESRKPRSALFVDKVHSQPWPGIRGLRASLLPPLPSHLGTYTHGILALWDLPPWQGLSPLPVNWWCGSEVWVLELDPGLSSGLVTSPCTHNFSEPLSSSINWTFRFLSHFLLQQSNEIIISASELALLCKPGTCESLHA